MAANKLQGHPRSAIHVRQFMFGFPDAISPDMVYQALACPTHFMEPDDMIKLPTLLVICAGVAMFSFGA